MSINWNPLAPRVSLLRMAGVSFPPILDLALEEDLAKAERQAERTRIPLPTKQEVIEKPVLGFKVSEKREQRKPTEIAAAERAKSSMQKYIEGGGTTGSRQKDNTWRHRSGRRESW